MCIRDSSLPVKSFTLDLYRQALDTINFWSSFRNSILITVVSVVIIISIGSMASYAISRRKNKLTQFLFFYFLIGFMVPVQTCLLYTSSLSAEHLEMVMRKLKATFDFSSVKEFTVEAGRPDSITEEKLKVLLDYGVTRISINPQTMKQATLDLIGRRHTVDMVKEKYRLAREMGFDNINMDLIIGLPEEDLEDVRHTMEEIRALDPDSITVHSCLLYTSRCV